VSSGVDGERGRANARRYLEIGQPERTLDALAGLGADDLDDPEVWLLRGYALADLDEHEEAADVAREGLERFPGDPDLLRLLSVAEAELGDLAEAERAVLAALRVEPDDTGLLTQYANVLMRGAQLDKADRVLERARANDPDDLRVVSAAMLGAFLRGDRREAEARSRAVLARDPDANAGHAVLGSLDLERVRLASAQNRFANVLREARA